MKVKKAVSGGGPGGNVTTAVVVSPLRRMEGKNDSSGSGVSADRRAVA